MDIFKLDLSDIDDEGIIEMARIIDSRNRLDANMKRTEEIYNERMKKHQT